MVFSSGASVEFYFEVAHRKITGPSLNPETMMTVVRFYFQRAEAHSMPVSSDLIPPL